MEYALYNAFLKVDYSYDCSLLFWINTCAFTWWTSFHFFLQVDDFADFVGNLLTEAVAGGANRPASGDHPANLQGPRPSTFGCRLSGPFVRRQMFWWCFDFWWCLLKALKVRLSQLGRMGVWNVLLHHCFILDLCLAANVFNFECCMLQHVLVWKRWLPKTFVHEI